MLHGQVLLGAFEAPEAAVEFLSPIARDFIEADIARRWTAARREFLDAPDPGVVRPVTTESSDYAEVAKRILRSSRDSLAEKRWSIIDFPLDALIAFQPMVVCERVEMFRDRLAGDVLDVLYPASTEIDVGVHAVDGPGISLVSSRGELAVSGARVQRDRSGALEVIVRVEPRPNYVSALRMGDRWVLRNGYHRLCAVWRSGARTAPLVVIEAGSEQVPSRLRGGFSAAVIGAERPPRLRDLAEVSGATFTVPLRKRHYEITVRAARTVHYEND